MRSQPARPAGAWKRPSSASRIAQQPLLFVHLSAPHPILGAISLPLSKQMCCQRPPSLVYRSVSSRLSTSYHWSDYSESWRLMLLQPLTRSGPFQTPVPSRVTLSISPATRTPSYASISGTSVHRHLPTLDQRDLHNRPAKLICASASRCTQAPPIPNMPPRRL